MRHAPFFFWVLLLAVNASGQKIFESYTPQNGVLQYGNGPKDVFPYNEKGYTLILPDTKEPLAGVIISLEDGRVDPAKMPAQKSIHPQANARGFAVLYVSTGIPVDLYFKDSSLDYVDTVLTTVFAKYKIPNKDLFFLGSMVAGHRALKYIEYCKKGRSRFAPDIKGVILSECAIDWVRQWYECQKQVSMRHIQYFKDLAVRAYTFAPTSYWFSATGKGVYDCNTRICPGSSTN